MAKEKGKMLNKEADNSTQAIADWIVHKIQYCARENKIF